MFRIWIAGFLCASSVGWASAFDDIDVTGPCSKRNMEIIENAGVLSILLHDFGANMPLGQEGDGKLVRKVCQFRVRITFPTDQYLAGLTQVFSGGLIKSKQASGQLQIFSRIFKDIHMPQPLRWKAGEAISPESEKSLFSIVLDEAIPKPTQCRGRIQYQTRLSFLAARPDVQNEFFVGAVDSIDSEMTQRFDLIPNWQRCDGKPQPHRPGRPTLPGTLPRPRPRQR
jgi:hypothetical protein